MKKYTAEELKGILDLNKKELGGLDGGEVANLSGTNLYRIDSSKANLYGADLAGANLSKVNSYRDDLGRDVGPKDNSLGAYLYKEIRKIYKIMRSRLQRK